MKIRKTVRALLLNLDRRVLLIKHREVRNNGTEHIFWAAPGGGVEEGEDDKQALSRELYEELGFDGPVEAREVWRRRLVLPILGTKALFEETYYLVKTEALVNFKKACTEEEKEALMEVRWFTERELQACTDIILPEGFATLISPLLRDELPETPVLLGEFAELASC